MSEAFPHFDSKTEQMWEQMVGEGDYTGAAELTGQTYFDPTTSASLQPTNQEYIERGCEGDYSQE